MLLHDTIVINGLEPCLKLGLFEGRGIVSIIDKYYDRHTWSAVLPRKARTASKRKISFLENEVRQLPHTVLGRWLSVKLGTGAIEKSQTRSREVKAMNQFSLEPEFGSFAMFLGKGNYPGRTVLLSPLSLQHP